MSIKDKLKKILLSFGIVAIAATAIAFAPAITQNSENAFEDESAIAQSQDINQEAVNQKQKELNFLSEYQVKYTSALLDYVFSKHLSENNVNSNMKPIVIDGTPYLITNQYLGYINSAEDYSESFYTKELYKLENNDETNILFENLSLLTSFREGNENITLDQAKHSLAELAVLLNLGKKDILKLASVKNPTTLINNSYNQVKEDIPDFLTNMIKLPNVKGSTTIKSSSSMSMEQQILNYIRGNFNNLQPVEAELEQ